MPIDTRREPASGGRLALVSSLLAEALATPADGGANGGTDAATGAARRILDCGGGSGAFAVPLAVGGADVTVVDISADALATLRRRADEAGVGGTVHAVAGDVDDLTALVDPGSFDAVLAHGILDAVDRPETALAAMAAAVRPGGLVSVLVANPVAAVLARALAGAPIAALAELRRLDEPGRVGPDAVARAATAAGLVVEARHGIGVFSDLVPGSAGDAAGGREAIASLDAEVAGRAPFADIAGRIHLLLRRPGP